MIAEKCNIQFEGKPPGPTQGAIRWLVENWANGEEMTATSRYRRSWKDSPRAKAIAATVASLLLAGLIAFAVLSIR